MLSGHSVPITKVTLSQSALIIQFLQMSHSALDLRYDSCYLKSPKTWQAYTVEGAGSIQTSGKILFGVSCQDLNEMAAFTLYAELC